MSSLGSVFAQSSDDLAALNTQVVQLHKAGKYSDAILIAQRALALAEHIYGPSHLEVAKVLNGLAELHRAQGQYAEAEPVYARSLSIAEGVLGHEHPIVGLILSNLASLFQAQGRFAEADSLYQRSIAIQAASLGPDRPQVAIALTNLGALYVQSGRFAEAELPLRRAISILEKSLGRDHPDVAAALNNLAALHHNLGHDAEAELLYKQALTISERALGFEHPSVATSLNNLALFYQAQGLYIDAELLLTRSLSIREKTLHADHPDIGASIHNLAELYRDQGRYADSEPLYKRAILLLDKALGPDHLYVATAINSLAELYRQLGRYAEAMPYYERSLSLREKALGFESLTVADSLDSFATLYADEHRYDEAEKLYMRSLSIKGKVLNPHHPAVGDTLNNLGFIQFGQGHWARAVEYWRQSTDIIIQGVKRGIRPIEPPLTRKAMSSLDRGLFRALAKATYRLTESDQSQAAGLLNVSFKTAQWGQGSAAAFAIAQMAKRQSKGSEAFAHLLRERQDLVGQWRGLDQILVKARSEQELEARAKQIIFWQGRIGEIEIRLDEIDKTLVKDFPDYAVLANPEPVEIKDVRALLHADEALLLFLDTPDLEPTPEETFIWVITKTDTRWFRSELGSKSLARHVAALRCGLDRNEWDGDGASRCANAQGINLDNVPKEGERLPFDLARAHVLYQFLFGQVANLIKDKHLLIVPSGPLTQLPFHMLVTEKPDATATGAEAFSRAAWLAKSNAITVLPAVSSLKALREHAKAIQSTKAFAGFGNPLLDGRDAGDSMRLDLARARQHCSEVPLDGLARLPGGPRGTSPPQQRGGLAELAEIRAQVPLPETADELCAVARALGVPESEIRLGARANEREIKRLSDSGELGTYRILHFATHGALAGELKAGAEPGLILTPPREASQEDDGYLSASEIGDLKLNADWVILSACNSAAGGAPGGEALSGLARAFFYAGARSLLVSHWAVDSDSTVKLITKALTIMASDKSVGRAEAMRRSMVAMIESGNPKGAHPAYWAPFVVVGEGSSAEVVAPPVVGSAPSPAPTAARATTPSVTPPTDNKKGPLKARPKPNDPWTAQIWKRQ
jgi:CHAT domain-containing protein/tetratricopeptide (TPR) repeat protein